MDLIQTFHLYKNQPITRQLLMDSLVVYKRPNDKVGELLKSGVLKAVKRGIYLPGPITFYYERGIVAIGKKITLPNQSLRAYWQQRSIWLICNG